MKLRFTGKLQESGDIWSFFFDPLEPTSWKAGQSIRLELPRKSWGYDERRFTISSAPYEEHIRITTRLSGSEFKQNLASLEPDKTIDGHNVEGDFVWEDDARHKLLLAAGVGITPFRSLLMQAAHDGSPLNASLVYATKDTPPPFLEEFAAIAAKDKSLTVFVTPNRIALPDKADTHWLKSTVYISGPEPMVQSLAHQALEMGLPKNQLKTDLFTGF